jgi:hypothetical protein
MNQVGAGRCHLHRDQVLRCQSTLRRREMIDQVHGAGVAGCWLLP